MTLTKADLERIQQALDMLGLALTETVHVWKPAERLLYEDATRRIQKALAGCDTDATAGDTVAWGGMRVPNPGER